MKYICQPAEVKVCRFAYVEREREADYISIIQWHLFGNDKFQKFLSNTTGIKNNQCLMSTVIAA